MANKKISELDSRASMSLSDLLAIGDPSTGYLYKTTISDLKTLTGAGVISFNGRYGNVTPAEGDYSLTQLSDVIITSPSNNQVVRYNGSNWVNATLDLTTTLAALQDVAIASLANGQLLRYNSTSGKWENWTPNYLTAEADTLATVTARGNATSGNIAVAGKLTIGTAYAGTGQRIEADGTYMDFVNSAGGGWAFRWIQNGGTAMQISTTNNVLIGTTTDAGYRLDVNGSVKVGTAGVYGTNGTYNAALIKFNASNLVEIDGSGYGAKASSNFTVAGYNYAIGRVTTDSYVIAKGGSSTPGTAFVSYGIGRPDTTGQVSSLAGFGGVYEGATWANGLGLSFFTSSATDISGGTSITEKMRLKAGGDLMVNSLAGTGSRMVVADANGVLSTQAIPTFNLGSLSASAPLSYNSGTGAFSISQASSSANGYLSSTDWNTFNGKQAALGYTAANDSAVVHIAGNETITGVKTFSANTLLADGGIAFKDSVLPTSQISGYVKVFFRINSGKNSLGLLSSATSPYYYTYDFPNAAGTIALTSDIPSLSGYVPYTGATSDVNVGSRSVYASNVIVTSGGSGMLAALTADTANGIGILDLISNSRNGYLKPTTLTVDRTWTLPDASGTIALTSNLTGLISGTGTTGRIPFFNGTSSVASDANFSWDNTNKFIATAGVYVLNNTSNAYMLSYTGDQIGSIFTSASNKWHLGYGTSATTQGTPVLTWNDSGNVGIGTTSPASILEVKQISGETTISANYNGSYYAKLFSGNGYSGVGSFSNMDFIIYTNSTEKMRIVANGNVLIGTTSNGSQKLQVNGTLLSSNITINNTSGNQQISFMNSSTSKYALGTNVGAGGTNDFAIYNYVGGGTGMVIYANNNYQFFGSNVSDIRAKEDIKNLEFNATEKVLALIPKSYYMKNDNKQIRYGFIAQDVSEILPDLIKGDIKGDDLVGLDYNGIIPVLVKAMQEQQSQIEQLKARLN